MENTKLNLTNCEYLSQDTMKKLQEELSKIKLPKVTQNLLDKAIECGDGELFEEFAVLDKHIVDVLKNKIEIELRERAKLERKYKYISDNILDETELALNGFGAPYFELDIIKRNKIIENLQDDMKLLYMNSLQNWSNNVEKCTDEESAKDAINGSLDAMCLKRALPKFLATVLGDALINKLKEKLPKELDESVVMEIYENADLIKILVNNVILESMVSVHEILVELMAEELITTKLNNYLEEHGIELSQPKSKTTQNLTSKPKSTAKSKSTSETKPNSIATPTSTGTKNPKLTTAPESKPKVKATKPKSTIKTQLTKPTTAKETKPKTTKAKTTKSK